MKNLFLVAAMMMTAGFANAATNNLRPLVGFDRGALNFGAEYENRYDSLGVGGMFLIGSEKKDAGKNQMMTFAGMATAHFLDDTRFNLYLSPGAGITMWKGLNGADDQTLFGPVFKTGALFKVSSTLAMGLDHVVISNWFSDKVGSEFHMTNFAVNLVF